MIQLVCDLCGKPLYRKAVGSPGIRRFRVKENRWIQALGVWGGWEEMDCHEECVMALMNAWGKAKETMNES